MSRNAHSILKTDKLDFLKIKLFELQQTSLRKMKTQAIDWEKTFANLIKGLYPE